MTKATVQAAIGAIPLSMGIKREEIILALAVLSILTTAPIGAWGISIFAPKLLERGEVDPTKVTVAAHTVLLAAVDASPLSTAVLTKVASLGNKKTDLLFSVGKPCRLLLKIEDKNEEILRRGKSSVMSLYLSGLVHRYYLKQKDLVFSDAWQRFPYNSFPLQTTQF